MQGSPLKYEESRVVSMVVIDNKRERLCLVSAEGLARRETSLCYGATEHRYRTEPRYSISTHLRAKRFSAPAA